MSAYFTPANAVDVIVHDAGKMTCRICGNAAGATPYRVREMLHGTREAFDYVECGACGCVQIAEIPADLGRHYPADYFSFRDYSRLARNRARSWIDPLRVRRQFGGRSLVGAMAEAVSRPFDYVDWLKRAGLSPNARVLDVGCGGGKSLVSMKLGGVAHCEGLDPFIDHTLTYPNGVTIHRMDLETFAATAPQPFDLIMFHHALEHLVDPAATLRTAAGLLTKQGRLLIIVPVADSHAWEHYREDWINLDPPRHLHLLTRAAIAVLARSAGLAVESAVSVGRLSQFAGSERYRRDIPANAPIKDSRLFGRRRLREWRRATDALNREGRGDQTMFYLKTSA